MNKHASKNRAAPRPPLRTKDSALSTAPARPTHWGHVAAWYDDLVGDQGSEYHQHVIIPGVQRMLSTVPAPKRILDLACGQGVLCRVLAKEGWDVVGIDAAPELIAAAQDRAAAEALPGQYHVADATKLLDETTKDLALSTKHSLSPSSFAAITCLLAIQNLTPLSPVWQACHQLLRPGGALILVLMHPCFRIPRHSDWVWDAPTATQFRRLDQYLTSAKIEIQTHPGRAAHGHDTSSTVHFHRPLQAYINTLGSAGLLIEHLEEWPSHKKSQPGPKQQAFDHSRKEIPLFMALRARKV